MTRRHNAVFRALWVFIEEVVDVIVVNLSDRHFEPHRAHRLVFYQPEQVRRCTVNYKRMGLFARHVSFKAGMGNLLTLTCRTNCGMLLVSRQN